MPDNVHPVFAGILDTYRSGGSSKPNMRAFAYDAARGLLSEGNTAADHAVRMLASLRHAGLTDAEIEALRATLLDAFGDVQGRIDRILDNEGLAETDYQIDLAELAKP